MLRCVTAFDDLLAANAEYAAAFEHSGLTGKAARGLAVVTCMDSRIDPLGLLGLRPGDAKILRNAGARAFYERLGFREVPGAPAGTLALAFEDFVG